MSYLAILLNHLRAVKGWADGVGAEAQMDVRSCVLEVKCRNRYYRFIPRFLVQRDGRLSYSNQLVDDVSGFIGWLPYAGLHLPAADKLVFKRLAADAGVRVPATWAPEAPGGPYLLKRSAGSFGYQIAGPYRKGATQVRPPPEPTSAPGRSDSLFAEQFVEGEAIKLWFWGAQPFYAQRQAWPRLRCDGTSSLAALAAQRLGVPVADLASAPDWPFVQDSLAYQDLSPQQVLPAGREPWMDFRYGRTYEPLRPTTRPDNELDSLPAAARADAVRIGAALAAQTEPHVGAPVLSAVDAVLDPAGQAWWLEVNLNPVLPPEGYALVFETLFGVRGVPQ